MNEAFDPTSTFLDLTNDGRARHMPVDERFWEDLSAGRTKIDGRLVSASHIAADMRHWERHPGGDELLCLFSGSVVVVLEVDDGERRVTLDGDHRCYVVPRRVWHRFTVNEPSMVLFVTPGEGTEHKPL